MTYGPDVEYSLLRNFFKGESFPDLWSDHTFYLILADGYPGDWIDADIYYNALVVQPSDWDIVSHGTYGPMIANNVAMEFYAFEDFPTALGGWGLVTVPTLPSNNMFFGDGIVTPRAVYAGDRIVFNPGDLTIAQNGGSLPGHFTDFAEEVLLKFTFGKATYPPPNIWIGLLYDNPTDLGTNDDCTEIPWLQGGYRRVATSFSDWQSVGWGMVHNLNSMEFPRAEDTWGTVNYFGLFDVETPFEAGHLLIYGVFTTDWSIYPLIAEPYFIGPGAQPRFDAGDLTVRFSV